MEISRFECPALLPLLKALAMLSAITIILTLLASSVSASASSCDNIILGKENAYSLDKTSSPPWTDYSEGDLPPIMASAEVGSGKVVAGGVAATCRNGRWEESEWDAFLDETFQWMVPGAENVLWYGNYGTGYNVYYDAGRCSRLIDNLRREGYTMENTGVTPITSSLLEPYDILVIPGMELDNRFSGGDPSLLPDNDVRAIKNFVEGGGGLLIMDQTDYAGWNYYRVQNKILAALNMGIYFQNDSLYDDVNNRGDSWRLIADVNPESGVGAAYQGATGENTVSLWSACSLAEPGYIVFTSPNHKGGLQGWTLEYTIKILNMHKESNTYNLAVSDSENWDSWLENSSLTVPAWGVGSTTLAVTIPQSANLGTEDNILVAVSSENVEKSSWSVARVGLTIMPTDDVDVEEGRSTMNFGSEGWLWISNLPTGTYLNERSFLKFDLTSIPAGVRIASARLYLYSFREWGADSGSVQACSVENDYWTELSMTWENQPNYENVLDTNSVSAQDNWCSWDVTNFVKEQHAIDNLASFCMKAEFENVSGPDNFTRGFRSKEWKDVALRPYLEIEFGFTPTGENVQVKPAPGTVVTFGSVDNSGTTSVNTSTDGPAPPTAYEIVGLADQSIYYDINTTATYSGSVNVCISYDENQTSGSEGDLQLMHLIDNVWEDITVSIDTENNVICGETESLSPFIVVESSAPTPPPEEGPVGGIVHPIDKFELMMPWIVLTVMVAVSVTSLILFWKRLWKRL